MPDIAQHLVDVSHPSSRSDMPVPKEFSFLAVDLKLNHLARSRENVI